MQSKLVNNVNHNQNYKEDNLKQCYSQYSFKWIRKDIAYNLSVLKYFNILHAWYVMSKINGGFSSLSLWDKIKAALVEFRT